MKIPVNLFKSWNCDLIFWGKHLKWINLLLHLTCLCNGLHINNCHLARKSDAIWSQIAIALSLACKYQVHKSIIVNCTCLNSYLGSDLICGPMGVGIAHIFTNILLCTWYLYLALSGTVHIHCLALLWHSLIGSWRNRVKMVLIDLSAANTIVWI